MKSETGADETNWPIIIGAEVKRFTQDTGISSEVLGEALGLYKEALYLTHLQRKNACERVIVALRPVRLYQIVAALNLNDRNTKSLLQLQITLYQKLLGVEDNHSGPRARLRAATEIGLIADKQFDGGQREQAVPRLEHSWERLCSVDPFGTDPRATFAAIRVGVQLASWHDAQGNSPESMRIIKHFGAFLRNYRGNDRDLIRAHTNLLMAAAMAERHTRVGSSEGIIKKLEQAEKTFREDLSEDVGQVAALRDMAKPYLRWGLGIREGYPNYDRIKNAEEIALLSEVRAGGSAALPEPEMQTPWLYSRLNRIEVLCLNPAKKQLGLAQQLWEETMAMDFVAVLLGSPVPSTLKAKGGFAALALAFAGRDWDTLGNAAQAYSVAEENASFQDRVKRAAQMVKLAENGDAARITDIFLS